MAFKIYTKTGDSGSTSLIGGTKISKADLRIEAYGTVDELNSYIGLCGDLITNERSKKTIQEIQDRLFTIGSSLAVDPAKESKLRIPDLHESDIEFLEQEIDMMDNALPTMKHFILPGGHITVSNIHITRCVCRRAERLCVRLVEFSHENYALIIKYLNRLSDYLFMLARFTGQELNAPEIPWKPRI
ncbi:MAG: cob(I)yrinic acid a,c-diamide adenosyltransferase [Chitinophagaceae bacterium]|nr:MAG: cob(I)yrinic acid a,c-diamide adenosyltransferase [Chitinophagaceae bacterium]